MALHRSLGFTCILCVALFVHAGERPPVTSPRQTSSDTAVEPDWAQRLTVTVGNDKADLVGNSDRPIQAAVDYVARLGGGTVRILPGTYHMRNSVYLQSKVRLLGAGAETVLIKDPSSATKLAADSDWYDQEITLADASGFEVGDGVCLRAHKEKGAGDDIVKRTLVARTGNRFKLDRALKENFWQVSDATASTLFPIISGEFVTDVAIENVTLDGNREHNANLDGNYAGCIFIQDCARVTMRGVIARNYNGDGISFQICHDVVVEGCTCTNNAQLAIHAGSGSQRPIMRNNRIEGNGTGLFFCWGVKYGLAEKNHIVNNGIGVSIGHRDTDNLVQDNDILRSTRVGLLFRPERGKGFTGDRNRIEHNRIIDSGTSSGVAVDVQGTTESIELKENEIVETREPAQRVAVRLGAQTHQIQLQGNTIKGFAEEVKQLK